MSEQLVKRLRELSNAVTRADWNEFSMRIPVEKDRDADFVLLQAADKIAALEADAARMKDALLQIKEMTDAEGDEDTYRLDDPEGCFDTVFAVAEQAIKPDDEMKGGA